jgi:hypothetical protein
VTLSGGLRLIYTLKQVTFGSGYYSTNMTMYVNGLTILVLSQGQAELNQCMLFSLSRSDSVQVRFDWGITPAIPTH